MEARPSLSTPEDIVADMTALAMSSDTLLGRARLLAAGESFSFLPCDIQDSPDHSMYPHLAGEMRNAFIVNRLAPDCIPEEYGLAESDLPEGSLVLLIAAEAAPNTCQLAILDSPNTG